LDPAFTSDTGLEFPAQGIFTPQSWQKSTFLSLYPQANELGVHYCLLFLFIEGWSPVLHGEFYSSFSPVQAQGFIFLPVPAL
jgi:hypothetical protein